MSVTHHAPAARSLPEELEKDIRLFVNNPITSELMRLADGMVMVVNENRQIISANRGVQEFLGVESAESFIGMRPGEAVQCVYSGKMDAGCGTSLECSSCGAVNAVLEARESGKVVERKSALQRMTTSGPVDMCIRVRACPLGYEGRRFIILLITDITQEERRCELERIFKHDILNTALGVNSACRLLERNISDEGEAREYARIAKSLSNGLMKDIHVHSLLSEMQEGRLELEPEHIDVGQFMDELRSIAETWPAARKVRLEVIGPHEGITVRTDPHLLHRVMTNMLLNACEASKEEDTVRFWAEKLGSGAVFNVWNSAHIPENIAPRIFQRHFSTKPGRGRGVGTHSMKFIGERLLGGRISFSTSRDDGTVFSILLK